MILFLTYILHKSSQIQQENPKQYDVKRIMNFGIRLVTHFEITGEKGTTSCWENFHNFTKLHECQSFSTSWNYLQNFHDFSRFSATMETLQMMPRTLPKNKTVLGKWWKSFPKIIVYDQQCSGIVLICFYLTWLYLNFEEMYTWIYRDEVWDNSVPNTKSSLRSGHTGHFRWSWKQIKSILIQRKERLWVMMKDNTESASQAPYCDSKSNISLHGCFLFTGPLRHWINCHMSQMMMTTAPKE